MDDSKPHITTVSLEESVRIDDLAELTYAAFQEHVPGWLPTLEDARRQIEKALGPDRICRVMIDSTDQAVAWIGAIPINHGRIWEIHPLVVAVHAQGMGYGRMLVAHLEQIARQAGVLGLIAGTSDSTDATSLSGADLYANPLQALANIRSKHRHPYEFWLKVGFTIVGVLPDAEGRGKPGISLAKRIDA